MDICHWLIRKLIFNKWKPDSKYMLLQMWNSFTVNFTLELRDPAPLAVQIEMSAKRVHLYKLGFNN